MGNTNLHNSKEKWYSKVHLRLQILKQVFGQKAYLIPKIADVLQKLEGICYAKSTGSQHGLSNCLVKPRFTQIMYYNYTMG